MNPQQLHIHETFSSLQGEGPHCGRPAFFIRLSGCVPPLCPWCDTKGAWQGGVRTRVSGLMEAVQGGGHSFVVITGGEPMLQWSQGLAALDQALYQAGIMVQYETSGKAGIPSGIRGEVVCSPKYLAGRWQLDDGALARADHCKLVACPESLPRIDELIRSQGLEPDRVWLMPQGAERAQQLQLLPILWEHCVRKGYRLSSRLHILAFDTKKGI
ncbi:7-carboxy-7-deazaguanine synthase QueE [Desulfogranum mediterraneum]|uniref:7-carboxy-7-deazaguanine synthase QueE n=1 Tax=Desulfogranum mediterraneum TaxID=160661 RepID=UPI000416BC24|nr:7-carboxy-7-deazaguanine synthase QueE [Desulfogranum mediterraneum]